MAVALRTLWQEGFVTEASTCYACGRDKDEGDRLRAIIAELEGKRIPWRCGVCDYLNGPNSPNCLYCLHARGNALTPEELK